MGQWNFFTDQEMEGLKDNLPAMLDAARKVAGVPFVLTFTTGGKHCGHSAHYKGLAVDIGLGHLLEGADRDRDRFLIIKGLCAAGFQRIETAKSHIHADIGQPPEYVSPILWMGADA
jgi:hypothetical protein